jgi:hypothetical protein
MEFRQAGFEVWILSVEGGAPSGPLYVMQETSHWNDMPLDW